MAAINKTVSSVLFGVLGIVNVSGNALIMAVIARNKSMRTPVNYLLLSLAVADMLVGITSIASKVVLPYVTTHPQGIADVAVCKLLTTDNIFWICGHTSATILVVIAYERYQVVVHPYTVAKKITNKRMMLAVVVCWVINAAIMFNWIVLSRIDVQTGHCGFDQTEANKFFMVFRYFHGVSFVVPFLLMAFLYGRVVWVIVKKTDQVMDGQQLAVTRMKKRVTIMLLVATATYLATCGPLSVITLLQTSAAFVFTVLYELKMLSVCLNSTINAFIYALFSIQFRQGFKNILFCKSLTKKLEVSERNARSDVTLDTKL